MSNSLPRREEVPEEFTWDIKSVFPSQEAWEEAFTESQNSLTQFAPFVGKLSVSGETLWKALQTRDRLGVMFGRVALYTGMLRAGDVGNQAAAALGSRAGGLGAKFGAETAFYEPEILAMSPEHLDSLIAQEPRLELYRHYFDTLARRRSHVRSAEVEAVLAQASEAFSATSTASGVLTNAEIKFPTAQDSQGNSQEVAQGTIGDLTRSEDRTLRQSSWESYADGYLGVQNTLAACLTGSMKRAVFSARVHHYDSVLESMQSPNALPRAVFDNLISTFQANLPTWHRYWSILRRALGVETLHTYDIPTYGVPAPIARTENVIDFAEATELICAGMSPMGERYVQPMRRGLLEERWVDRAPNLGKGSGAFSSGAVGTHPFIMMNYRDDIFSVSTLAHELGHSLHSYFTRQTQPPIYSRYSMFVAETASNFDQAMVRSYLLREKNSDPAFILGVVEEAISNFHRYFFVMPTLARFELDCYGRLERGEALTSSSMSARLVELFQEGYGPEVVIDAKRLGITWAQFGHLYSPYYVYQYATGIAAANALAEDVAAQGEPAADRYLEFLKAGGAMYPIDALKLAGIDMTTPEPVERAFGVLASMIDRLDSLV